MSPANLPPTTEQELVLNVGTMLKRLGHTASLKTRSAAITGMETCHDNALYMGRNTALHLLKKSSI